MTHLSTTILMAALAQEPRWSTQIEDRPLFDFQSLNKIQMIDGGTLDLHQDLVACDRGRRYIVEHQLPTVFQQSDSFQASSP